MSEGFLNTNLTPILSSEKSVAPALTSPLNASQDLSTTLLQEAVEVLLRRRGRQEDSAVTVRDLEKTLTALGTAINSSYGSMAKFEAYTNTHAFHFDGLAQDLFFGKQHIRHDNVGGWDLNKRRYVAKQPGMYLIVISLALPVTPAGDPYEALLHVKTTGEADAHQYFRYSVGTYELFTQQTVYLTYLSEGKAIAMDLTLDPLTIIEEGGLGLSLSRI